MLNVVDVEHVEGSDWITVSLHNYCSGDFVDDGYFSIVKYGNAVVVAKKSD